MLTRVNNTELYWAEHGEGQPIVMVHGGPGFDHTHFRPWLDELADSARLIYYDQRGTGRSSRTDGFDNVSFHTLVEDLEGLRGQLRLERFTLLGHCFGGNLALAYAQQYAERLNGLILCSTAPSYAHLPAALSALRDRMNPEQQAVFAGFTEPVPDDLVFKHAWRMLHPLYFAQYQPGYAEAVVEPMHGSAIAWNHLPDMLEELNACATRDQAACPILSINGKHDWFVGAEQVQQLQALLPQASLVGFEDSGHFPFIEEHDRFLAAVRDWIKAP